MLQECCRLGQFWAQKCKKVTKEPFFLVSLIHKPNSVSSNEQSSYKLTSDLSVLTQGFRCGEQIGLLKSGIDHVNTNINAADNDATGRQTDNS